MQLSILMKLLLEAVKKFQEGKYPEITAQNFQQFH